MRSAGARLDPGAGAGPALERAFACAAFLRSCRVDGYHRRDLARVHHEGFGAHADACAPGILALLATAMDPRFVSLLTLTVIPGTSLYALQQRGSFTLPPVRRMLEELRTFADRAAPTDATSAPTTPRTTC